MGATQPLGGGYTAYHDVYDGALPPGDGPGAQQLHTQAPAAAASTQVQPAAQPALQPAEDERQGQGRRMGVSVGTPAPRETTGQLLARLRAVNASTQASVVARAAGSS